MQVHKLAGNKQALLDAWNAKTVFRPKKGRKHMWKIVR
jgi:hypothetical protein